MCLCHSLPVSILLNCVFSPLSPLSLSSAAAGNWLRLVGSRGKTVPSFGSGKLQWPLSMLVGKAIHVGVDCVT